MLTIAAADPVNYFRAIILGIVQGLTEFIPISSSAHIRITAAIAGWDDPGAAFTAVTQIGTELAVVLYFRNDILHILRAWFRSLPARRWPEDPDARMGWLIIIGTLPVAILGLALQNPIDDAFRDLRLTAFMLIVFGLLLGWADANHRSDKPIESLTVRDGLIYGFAQALALIPGTSRSGATITAGRILGYSREAATRYAFLLALPAVFASGLFELKDIGSGPGKDSVAWGPTILATVIAFFIGLAVIAWLMKYLRTRSYAPFVAYRVALGIFLIILITAGGLDPNAAQAITK
ncbi:MAG: undecaprenyl-diphosphate phosphatase [Solirubrobacteraceae bacterium]|nr:undecaprenyl-diphosphate phosphatase [Patulibacter sp.]